MSYNKNTVFYKNFTDNEGIEKTLYFVPGDDSDLLTPNIVEFPDNVIIFDTIKTSAGYDADLPIGMQMAKSLKFSINLTNMVGDWTDVRDWIVARSTRNIPTPVKISYNGKDYWIPNRWVLCYKNDDNSNHIIADTVQDMTAKSKFKIEFDEVIYDIECLGIEKTILTQLNIEDFEVELFLLADLNQRSQSILYWQYDIGSDEYIAAAGHNKDEALFIRLTDLVEALMLKANELYQYFKRGYNFRYENDLTSAGLLSNLTFYQQSTTQNFAVGSTISYTDPSQIFILAYITNGSNVIGGALSKLSEASILNEFSTVWDLLRSLSESMPNISKFIYINESNEFRFQFNKPYEYNWANPAEDDYMTSISERNIDYSKIIEGSLQIEPNFNQVAQSSLVVAGVGDDNNNEFEYKNDTTLNSNSFDTKVLFNTNLILNNYTERTSSVKYYSNQYFVRNLYYYDGGFYEYKAVHPKVGIDFGYTFPTLTSSNAPAYSDVETYHNDIKQYANSLNANESYMYNLSQVHRKFLGNEFAGLLSCKLKIHNVNINQVGEPYTIDITDVAPYLQPPISQTAILVSCEMDEMTGEADCKFFLRDDNAV